MFIPCTTCLHILLAHPCLYNYYYLLSLQYTVQHILLIFIFYSYFNFFTFYSLVLCCVTYNCSVHWADLTSISLLIIFCIIEYVMNKTLNPWEAIFYVRALYPVISASNCATNCYNCSLSFSPSHLTHSLSHACQTCSGQVLQFYHNPNVVFMKNSLFLIFKRLLL